MNKFLLTMAVMLGTCSLFAQRMTDLQVKLIEPVFHQTYQGDGPINIKLEFKNLGNSPWLIGDTILYNINVFNDVPFVKLTRDVPPGDTLLRNGPTLVAPDKNDTIDFCVLAIIRNASNPITESQSVSGNNRDCDSIILKKKTVSVNDVNAFMKPLSVYPNPTTDEISFNAEGFINKAFDIQVIDMMGRIVITQSYKDRGNEKKIPVGHLNSGIYQVRISQEGHRYIGKFSKQ